MASQYGSSLSYSPTEQQIQSTRANYATNNAVKNSGLFKDPLANSTAQGLINTYQETIARNYQAIAAATEARAKAEQILADEASASAEDMRSAQARLDQSQADLERKISNIDSQMEQLTKNADEYTNLIKSTNDSNQQAVYRQKALDESKKKGILQDEKVKLEEELGNTKTSKVTLGQSISKKDILTSESGNSKNGISFIENPTGWLELHATDLIPIIVGAVASYVGLNVVGGGLFGGGSGGSGGSSGSGAGGGNSSLEGFAGSVFNTLNGLLNRLFSELEGAVDSAVNTYAASMGKVNARLYGTDDMTFESILSDLRDTVGSSMVVNQASMIGKLVELTQKGVVYNLEQRALLATLSEDLVPTFEVLGNNIERMIRLQQADITLSRMGAEAQLQQVLNSVFKDSSYLNNTYDDVYSAITDALAMQADTDQATQFGYTVQKWLGGLYSVGFDAATSLANAINLLGTGNVNALNEQQTTLLAMSASRAGLSYSSLLNEGLTAENTNALFKSMIEYLQDIANNTSGNVIKSEWGNILNISMADWKAIQNLSESDISNLYNSAITQQSAETLVGDTLMSILPTRIHTSEMINNAIDNTMLNFGMSIASNPDKYSQWKLLNLAGGLATSFSGDSSVTGGILNMFSSAATFATFAEDILKIPRDIFDLLTKGDNAIASIMSNYQATMDRGGMAYDSSGNSISYNISSSSNKLTIGFDDEDSEVFSDISAGLNTVNENGLQTNFLASDMDDETISRITTSAADSTLTTLQQQDEYQSATAQNVISQESVLVRDINDLYAELFEKQTTPIRVALAKVEDQGRSDIHSAIEGVTVNVSGGDDVFGGISSMRG